MDNNQDYLRPAWTERYYTSEGRDPYNDITWERRTATIMGENGKPVFQQENILMPDFWSQMATNIAASKYFRGELSSPKRENSLKTLISRVVDTISAWGWDQGYLLNQEEHDAFHDELTYLLLHQYVAFNSPVWFNCGLEEHPQVSACFINSVEDDLNSILNLAVTEGRLFKFGSGTGTNMSTIRSSQETLSGGGTASGPVSFMRGFDSFAGVIKSGGKTRRAAKMVILNIDHPDIEEFIDCKAHEEQKAWALIEEGYDGSFNGEAYRSVFFQNANHSVRVTDDFMKAVENDGDWDLHRVTDGSVIRTVKASALFDQIAKAAHLCGDPGLQYDTAINRWHTCKASGRINASNPCSEFMFLDDSACNLASLNLMRFADENGNIDIAGLRHAVNIILTAQEILVDNAAYPTDRITNNSRRYRPLGLGFANLGAYLMSMALPYDSDGARQLAAAITALITGQAYLTSCKLAQIKGPFVAYEENASAMLEVLTSHAIELERVAVTTENSALLNEAKTVWQELLSTAAVDGLRNAQVSLLAPTGTIGFLMDCDTTGIEPDIALVKYKQLVGGGTLKLTNNSVEKTLKRLGYSQENIQQILDYIKAEDTIEGAPGLMEEHLAIFDCALKPAKGQRYISPMGHLRMMAAVQPFISGAISKTVNMPAETTVEDIANTYMEAWRMGLKAVALYRDGSKRTQPVNTKQVSEEAPKTAAAIKDTQAEHKDLIAARPPNGLRHRLPAERQAITHKFTIGGHEGYITVGMYDDGQPGELFITISKEGSTISGLMDNFATSVSLALQYGVPLKVLVDKFSHSRFEPAGFTGNPKLPIAKSITDYIFRWLEMKFLQPQEEPEANHPHTLQVMAVGAGNQQLSALKAPADNTAAQPLRHVVKSTYENSVDAPACANCGSITVRSGSCYLCPNCGTTSGCS